MGQLIKLIMLYAPIGLGAYFAYMVGVFGPQLIGTYARVVGLYYPVAILYFIFGFSLYAFIATGRKGVKRFWTHIPPAALTAWGTGSSLAALPALWQRFQPTFMQLNASEYPKMYEKLFFLLVQRFIWTVLAWQQF
jgi:Na+/H+-dicarboxylate symporter